MNHIKFVAGYQAIWGDFPSAEKEEESAWWWELIDKIPDNYMDRLFETASRLQGDSKGRPRLLTFRKAWNEINLLEGVNPEGRVKTCVLCDETGYVSVPANFKDGIWTFDSKPGIVLELYAFPCRCQLGMVYVRRSKLAPRVIEEARAAYQDYRRAAGHPTELPPISKARFLAKPIGCSVVGLMRDVMVKTHIENGSCRPEEAVFPEKGATVKLWERRTANEGSKEPTWKEIGIVSDAIVDAISEDIPSGEDVSFDFGRNATKERFQEP